MTATAPLLRSSRSLTRATLIAGTVELDGASDPTVFSSDVESATRLDSGGAVFFTRIRLRHDFDFASIDTNVQVTLQTPNNATKVFADYTRSAAPSAPDARREVDVFVWDSGGVAVTTAGIRIHVSVLGGG